MRYLSQQLERAEKVLDRRLDIARQRKGEVGFVGEALEGANCTYLVLDLAASNLAAWRLSRKVRCCERVAPNQNEGAYYTGSRGPRRWPNGRIAIQRALAMRTSREAEIERAVRHSRIRLGLTPALPYDGVRKMSPSR